MSISQVRDEAELVAFCQVTGAALEADLVGLPVDPVEDFRPALDGPVNGNRIEYWIARHDGDVSAAATVVMPLHDNLDTAQAALFVAPACRGRGHGRAVSETLLRRVRATGRRRVLVEVPTHTRLGSAAPGEHLCESLGFRPALASKRRLLHLSTLRPGLLDGLAELAAAKAAGYSTVSWSGRAPDDYVDDLSRLTGLMSTDAPQGDIGWEPERWDRERYREVEDDIERRGRQRVCTAVVLDRTGEVVGYTDIGVAAGRQQVAYQWITIVAGEHRGHRIGLLSKVANLRYLRQEMPWLRYLNTWNADDNEHMIAINEQLGFEVAEGWNQWRLDFDSSGGE